MATSDPDTAEALTGLLYEGPLETPPFERFLAGLRDWLGADAASILVERQHRQLPDILLNIGGTPAVLQEWLTGLASSDWPALAAAPGVWFRLLSQAALAFWVS